MKFALYLASLLFIGAVTCRNIAEGDKVNKVDDSSSEETWTLDAKTTETITKKCKEVGGEVAAKKFNVALQTTLNCLNGQAPKSKEELKQELTSEGEDNSILCSKRRKAIRGCFTDLIEATKDCSVEEEKYAPEFFFDALDNLLDYVCEKDAKILSDVFESNSTWTCIGDIFDKAMSGNLTYVCTQNFKLLHDNVDNIVTKPELCEDLYTAKTCYSKFLTTECAAAKSLNEFLVGIFEAVSAPCKTGKAKRHIIQWDML